MNHLAVRLQEHWKTFLPSRYSQIPDPETHFAAMAEQAENEIADLWPRLAGEASAGETHLQKVGRLNSAKQRAMEMLAPDLFPSAEPGSEMDETDPEQEPQSDWIPMVEDPKHPFWQNQPPE